MSRRTTTWLLLCLLLVSWQGGPLSAAELTPAQATINESLAFIDANRLEEALESAKKAIKASGDGDTVFDQSEVDRILNELKQGGV